MTATSPSTQGREVVMIRPKDADSYMQGFRHGRESAKEEFDRAIDQALRKAQTHTERFAIRDVRDLLESAWQQPGAQSQEEP